jgi:hypothetical protein
VKLASLVCLSEELSRNQAASHFSDRGTAFEAGVSAKNRIIPCILTALAWRCIRPWLRFPRCPGMSLTQQIQHSCPTYPHHSTEDPPDGCARGAGTAIGYCRPEQAKNSGIVAGHCHIAMQDDAQILV